MRISIIGGGPAGLYFALLMKQANQPHDVTLYERDGPDDTFGWGIVFSDQTFSYLREADEPTFCDIVAACETWDNVDVVHRDQKVTIRGNRFSGIARITFLKILQRRCDALGVDLRYRANVADVTALPAADLVVGADGASSGVRQRFAAMFEPDVDVRRNKYIWLGTPRLFHGLTLTFREAPDGIFVAHSYKFSPTASTFIVECGEDTWERAGFARMTDVETCARLSGIFSNDLDGAPLLTNDFVKWLNFPLVKNRRWSHDNVVLIGDALHTAHFSIGSGTKLALEDAIALAQAIRNTAAVREALVEFERRRKPIIDRYQAAAFESLKRFENMDEGFDLPPIVFAYHLMTRSGRIDHEKLRQRDPGFVAAYERAIAGSS